MTGLLVGVLVIVIVAMAAALAAVHARVGPARTARRKQVAASTAAINAIDDVVDRYHPQLDLVGQLMADEIRQLISKHRKDTTPS